ncbi:hypothetical protein ABB37_00462 [Leptomonas pyrrhocoris]|uniref:Uncharacterized protein n=1 Tax=Leptomonas pyrrhocoris TaxID=157538 RepID=A0A0M9GAT3_LEPPY|nr:hypothetical protein ABB37_00462 [Leptomonas pyrrhocoris]KPA86226.1 hypothetical protein ABB37_00462 [Leptomonas pyrrhocoris]|eukprot:XP_015664665.1 hypothetical protein ABB37_00462 [Leptomonas pyrrhocoris]
MTDKTASPAVVAEDNTANSASIFGECVLKLTHSTTYEPPLYLFPELLPQVPQGTPPLPVWDAVADAVDISASSWRVADVSQLIAAGTAAAASSTVLRGEAKSSNSASRPPQAMVTLASMVAENRLLAAGLDASALKSGFFSSAGIIQQLATLRARMGLTEEEGAAIMSNHFINLLAWQKLCDINGGDGSAQAAAVPKRGEELHNNDAGASSSLAHPSPALSRKRARGAETSDQEEENAEEEDSNTWLPSPNPWATDAQLTRNDAINGVKFVSSTEKNVEGRVDLLRVLAKLYKRPWRTLTSQGQQTDCVVPPGMMNVTSPFADNSKVPGAMLDPLGELGWGIAASAKNDALFFGSVRVAHNACFYSVVLSSRTGTATTPPQRVPLRQLATHFGREAGVRSAAAVAAAALVPIDAGLEPYATHPEVLSGLHFDLVLRPVYEHKAELANEGRIDDTEEASSEDGATPPRDYAVVHTKTPGHYTLWLLNHGRNGIRIVGKGWILGEPRQLHAGDVLVVGNEVEVRVEAHTTAAAACASATEASAADKVESTSSSQVKRERADVE